MSSSFTRASAPAVPPGRQEAAKKKETEERGRERERTRKNRAAIKKSVSKSVVRDGIETLLIRSLENLDGFYTEVVSEMSFNSETSNVKLICQIIETNNRVEGNSDTKKKLRIFDIHV